MTDNSPASKILTELNIPNLEHVHTTEITSLEQAAAERNQDPSQVVRSIVFRLSEGEYAMVLIAGSTQVSWRALRQHFKQSRLTIASPEEVNRVTGYQIGAVSPFGILSPLPILVDQSILAQPAVSLGSGVIGTAIIITSNNLIKALGDYEVGKFT